MPIALRRMTVLAAAAVFVVLRTSGKRAPILSSQWLVPREWRILGPTRFAFVFGAFLGTSIFNQIPTGAFYVLAAGIFAVADPVIGSAIMAACAMGRASTLVAADRLRQLDPDRFSRLPLVAGALRAATGAPGYHLQLALATALLPSSLSAFLTGIV